MRRLVAEHTDVGSGRKSAGAADSCCPEGGSLKLWLSPSQETLDECVPPFCTSKRHCFLAGRIPTDCPQFGGARAPRADAGRSEGRGDHACGKRHVPTDWARSW